MNFWSAMVALTLTVLTLTSSPSSHAAMDRDVVNSSLRMAAREGRIKELHRLIEEEHVDVNATGEFGQTALLSAAMAGKPQVVELLLDHGADPEARDVNDNTPLMLAAFNCNVRAVKLLLEHDVNVNLQNHNGQTALINAVEQGCEGVVSALLKTRGIDVNVKNDWGKTALDCAETELFSDLASYERIVDGLRAAGAKNSAIASSLTQVTVLPVAAPPQPAKRLP